MTKDFEHLETRPRGDNQLLPTDEDAMTLEARGDNQRPRGDNQQLGLLIPGDEDAMALEAT